MTKGYVAGLFDFKYKHKLSRQRENYLISYLEREELQKVMQTRSITDSLLAVISPKQDIIEGAVTSIKEYIQMALPSVTEKRKIEDIKQVDRQELQSIRERLAKTKVTRKQSDADV